MPFLAPLIPLILPAIEGIGAGIVSAVSAIGVGAGLALAGDFAGAGVAFGFAASTSLIGSLTVGGIAELGALAGISALLAPHPAVNTAGSPQAFKPDPNAGVPVLMGRYGVGGNLVYETTSGGGNKTEAGAKGNEYLTQFVIISALGPLQAFETLRFNDTILTFDPNGQACNGGYIPNDEIQFWNPGYRHQNDDGSYINNNYQDHAWQSLQLGALNAGPFLPPDKLGSDNAGLPEWTSAHAFSNFAAVGLTMVYDQRYYAGGVPQPQWVFQGVSVYDPRLDSTFPGGNGPQRWAGAGATADAIEAARATWTFSENPFVHGLNYALGHFLPDGETGLGRLYAGIGAGTAGVNLGAFVRGANVADANGWKICGQWNTGDGKWSTLTEMLKAGSGALTTNAGIISCIVDTPLVSLGTVTAADLAGPVQLPTGSSFTARVNTIFPRFTSEAHRWQLVQADTPVKAATYVAEDGAVRSKTLDWQFVPAVNQACQVAAYTITNGREISGIELPGKPKLRNYAVGDCFTVDIPEAGLATTKVMVTRRVTDPGTGGVTLTVRTETDAKHAYSLGVSGVAPATPGISGFDPTIVEAPLPDFWATGAIEVSDDDTGESRSLIQITGSAADNVYAETLVVRWRAVSVVDDVVTPLGNGSWTYRNFPASQGQFELDLNPGTYDVQIAYITINGAYPAANEDWLDLGIETVGGSTTANTANVGTMSAADINASVAQLLSDIASLQEGDDPDTLAAQQAAAAAQAAEAAALAAQQQADTDLGQVESYANDVVTQTGIATQSADDSAASAYTATQAAGSASDSAGVATDAVLQVQVSGAETFPSGMSVPGFWTPYFGSNPASPYLASDSRFHIASDGAPVFANLAPGEGTILATVGTFVPVAGRTYTLTTTCRLTVAPTTVAHAYFDQSFVVVYSDSTQNPVVGAMGFDSANLLVGQLQTLQSTFYYDGAQPVAWARPYCVANAIGEGPDSDAVYEVLSLVFEDVTESLAAAGSASAALTFEQNASASESAASGYAATAGGAETAAVQAQGDAGTSATAAAGSAYTAGVQAGDASASAMAAQGFAGQAETYAGNAEAQAGYAEGYAASASGSESAAAQSAALVANYNPGANLVLNPTGGQGLTGWSQSSGVSIYASPNDAGGPCFSIVNPTGSALAIDDYLYQSTNYPVSAGARYSIQVECGSIGLSGGVINAGIIWNIPGQPNQYSTVSPPENVLDWVRYTQPNVIAPAGATTATFYLQSGDITFAPNGLLHFRKFKVETGSVCTPYTDDQIGAAITDVATAAADATEAVSDRTDTLESVVNDPTVGNEALSATVIEQAGTLADVSGKVLAFFKLLVAASGSTPALFQLASGDGTSVAQIAAAAISLCNEIGGAAVPVLTLEGGNAYFANAIFLSNDIRIDPAVPGIVFDNGSVACVLGIAFGANSNLVFWFGPSMSVASMTQANAKMFFDTSAGATFRGAFNSGFGSRTTSVQDPTVNPSANISTTSFPYTGNGITVVIGFAYSAGKTITTAGGDSSGANTVVVTLYRTINGGAEATVGSYSFQGTWDHMGGSTAEPGYDTSNCGGSFQVIDSSNVASGDNLVYRAAIVSYGIHSSGSPQQSLSLVLDEPA